MKEIQRNDLHIISKHSNIQEPGLQRALSEQVFAQKKDWQQFLKIFFLTLATGFLVTGIIFFFAYNWADLNKFVKLGIIQLLILSGILFVLFFKSNITVKNIVLTGTSMMVGALFAVFGQIYQTGANAYDFFLGWTVFIAIWTIVANFAPLWLLFLALINTTFYFYTDQVARYWDYSLIFLFFLLLNATALIISLLMEKYKQEYTIPKWFTTVLALAVTFFCTSALISLYEHEGSPLLWANLITVLLLYFLAIKVARSTKNILYLALLAVSIIIVIIYYLFVQVNDTGAIFLIALFCLAAFTITIKLLLDLQKKWNNGK